MGHFPIFFLQISNPPCFPGVGVVWVSDDKCIMQGYGELWRLMEICVGLWSAMEGYGEVWRPIEVYVGLWSAM